MVSATCHPALLSICPLSVLSYWQNCQHPRPRSQGSLLPALRVGENPGNEVAAPSDQDLFGGGGGGGQENLASIFLGRDFWGVFKIQNLPTQVIAIRFVNSLKRDENFSPAKCKIGVSTSKLDHYCFLLGPDLWSLNNCNQKRNNNHYQPLIICHYCL